MTRDYSGSNTVEQVLLSDLALQLPCKRLVKELVLLFGAPSWFEPFDVHHILNSSHKVILKTALSSKQDAAVLIRTDTTYVNVVRALRFRAQ